MAVALRLDPMLAEAYTSLGLIEANLFRWREAEKNFRKAQELNPNYSNTLLWYSLVLMGRSEIEESAAMVRRAEQIDPLSPLILSNFAQRLNMEGDYTGAHEKANTALEIDPRCIGAYLQLGLAYEGLGDREKAIAAYRKGATLSGPPGTSDHMLVRALVLSGDMTESAEVGFGDGEASKAGRDPEAAVGARLRRDRRP